MQNVTKDKFLGGLVELYQPKVGYRAGIDAVILAAASPAQANQEVLELGMGVGTAALCLAKRTGAHIFGVEIQPEYVTLARKNIALNGLSVEVFQGDVALIPKILKQKNFDHVIMNPPYFKPDKGTRSSIAGRDIACCGDVLEQWIEIAARRLKPYGILTCIAKAEQLSDVLGAIKGRLGSVYVLPLAARKNRPVHRIIIQAKKEGRGALVLCATRLLYEEENHSDLKQDYTQEFNNILKYGATLTLQK